MLGKLRDALHDEDHEVRVFAAEAIWNIEASSVAIESLVAVLKNRELSKRDARVRRLRPWSNRTAGKHGGGRSQGSGPR